MASSRPGNNQIDTLGTARPGLNGPKLIRLFMIVTIVCVLIGLAGIFVPKFTSGDGQQTNSDREGVVTTATDFAMAYNTYDVAKAADYQKRMSGLLSKSYSKEFDKITTEIFKALIPKRQVSNNAKVLGVAVDSIDKDSAVVLVAADATLSNTDNEAVVARHMRWRLNMVKQKGAWVVDKLTSVATAGASIGTPSATPSTAPKATPKPTPTEGSKAK